LTNNLATAHAKGITVTGTFTPSEEAKKLSTAPHFNNPSTPVWVRFSNSTGIPNIPDFDPNADPRGIGIRFILGDHKHTDIVSHSTPFFPVKTGALFLEFLKALAGGTIGEFLGSHPSALAFVQAPKPAPVSYGTEEYFSVTAFKLIDAAGKATFIRYDIVPDAGVHTLDAEAVKKEDPDYLSKELAKRLGEGPIGFKILAQVAEEGDVTDDATVHWPKERPVVTLGTLKLDALLENNEKEQKYFILDPIPRVQGVEASEDPLLELRAAVYLWSGKQRRAA
jgi:catalase